MVKSDKNAKKFGGGRYLGRIFGLQNSAANSARRNFCGGQISGGEFGDRRRLRGLHWSDDIYTFQLHWAGDPKSSYLHRVTSLTIPLC